MKRSEMTWTSHAPTGIVQFLLNGMKVPRFERAPDDPSCRMHAGVTVEVPPHSQMVVPIRTASSAAADGKGWVIEPTQLADALFSGRTALAAIDAASAVSVANLSDCSITIMKGTPMGLAEPVEMTITVAEADSTEPPVLPFWSYGVLMVLKRLIRLIVVL